MRITHKVDYAVRTVAAIARAEAEATGVPVKSEHLAETEGVPPSFLQDILRSLGNHGVLRSTRGPNGGWNLGRPAEQITVAEIIRDLEGPLASVRGIRPHELADHGDTEPFISLWVAVRAALRSVLDHVTVADLAAGRLPDEISAVLEDSEVWEIPPGE
jgi:Rrf2 family protein